jgi:hypothetical protein
MDNNEQQGRNFIVTSTTMNLPSEISEVKRLNKEISILTRIIERQNDEISRFIDTGAPNNYFGIRNSALNAITAILTAAVDEIAEQQIKQGHSINIDPVKILMSLIERSGIYNDEWYIQSNRDVADAGIDGLYHYAKYGMKEQRSPNANFC